MTRPDEVVTLEQQEELPICLCVSKHVPLYHRVFRVVDDIYVCPTTYENVLCLENEYKKYKGRPPGSVRKHFSDYVQKVVQFRYDDEQNS